MRDHSYENEFHLHENETVCRTHFHVKGFELEDGLLIVWVTWYYHRERKLSL